MLTLIHNQPTNQKQNLIMIAQDGPKCSRVPFVICGLVVTVDNQIKVTVYRTGHHHTVNKSVVTSTLLFKNTLLRRLSHAH